MTRTLLQRRSVAALGLSSILLLSACSGGGTSNTAASTSPSTSSSSAPSASATSSLPSASPTSTFTMPSYTPGQKLTTAQVVSLLQAGYTNITTAHIDMKTKPSKLDKNPVSLTLSADADYTTTPPNMAGTMTMSTIGKTQIKIVLVDGNFYLNLGALSQNLYYELSLAQLSSASGSSMLNDLDPSSGFKAMSAAVSGGTYVGPATVNGVATSHYKISVNTKKLANLTGGPLTGAPKSVIKKFKSLKTRVLEDVWMDSSGHIVKAVTSVMGETSTVTMSNFGASVQVTAPPSDEVTQAPGL